MLPASLLKDLICSMLICLVAARGKVQSVVEIARAYPDGGGYEWKGSGVPEEIRFSGEQILPKGKSTYCSGFTFAVVMKAAAERGLLADKSISEVRAFQKDWYGATKESGETQCAYALEKLGVGKSVTAERVRPGDFLQLWRTNKSGHSVVFLDWVTEGGRPIGVKYRGSQTSTNGIGDRVEYFAGIAGKKGSVDPQRLYFGRLNERDKNSRERATPKRTQKPSD
jgi:hypothetical protein